MLKRFIILALIPLFVLVGNITPFLDAPTAYSESNLMRAGYPYEKVDMQARFDYSGGSTIVYVGYCKPEYTIYQPHWQIMKLLYSGTSVIGVVYADGSNDYEKIWNDRASYTYLAE